MSKETRDDDFSRSIRETLEESKKASGENARFERIHEEVEKADPGLFEKISEIARTARYLNKAFSVAAAGMKKLGPVFSLATGAAGLVKDVFMFSAFERKNGDFARDEKGDLVFSPKRLAASVLLAAGFGASTLVGLRASYYYGTRFDEIVYTTGKQEIIDGELYQVTGCTSLPCSTEADNGKYYQIESSWLFPHQIYPEENVYANIPQQDAVCHFTGYGFYFKELKWLHRNFQWYQNLESATCRPYTQSEIQQAVESGQILESPAVTSPAPVTVSPNVTFQPLQP